MNPLASIRLAHASSSALLASRTRADWARWLTFGERERLGQLTDPGRRDSWMCGRLLAKQLLLREGPRAPGCDPGVGPGAIEIHSLDMRGRPIRPRATVGGRLLPWHLSIAHTRRSALVAVSCDSRVSVGVDVTAVDGYGNGFRELWLTPAERRWCETAEDRTPDTFLKREVLYQLSYGLENG